jgi:hypothetical protein
MIYLTKPYKTYYASRLFCGVKSTNFASLKPISSHLARNTRNLNILRANCPFKVMSLLTVFGRTPYFSQRQTARARTFLFPVKEVRMFGTLKLKSEEIFLFVHITCIHFALNPTSFVIIHKTGICVGFQCSCTWGISLGLTAINGR